MVPPHAGTLNRCEEGARLCFAELPPDAEFSGCCPAGKRVVAAASAGEVHEQGTCSGGKGDSHTQPGAPVLALDSARFSQQALSPVPHGVSSPQAGPRLVCYVAVWAVVPVSGLCMLLSFPHYKQQSWEHL